MTKKVVDYSNTIIYKIACKNKDIKDIYVGHTTNFIKRKYQHKLCCKQNLKNNKVNNCKIYKTINENGGWDNWEMIELEKLNCNTLIEAKQKEQEYYNLLNASLNSIPPYKKTPIENQNTNENINNNLKDILELSHNKYYCKKCNYSTNRKSNIDAHNKSNKHIRELTENKIIFSNEFCCKLCNKTYKTASGLWKHNKTCKENNVGVTDENIILAFLKENNELKDLLLNHTSMVIELLKNNNSNT